MEFFISSKYAEALKKVLAKHGSRIHYHLIDKCGTHDYTNADRCVPNAVTWGIFAGKEIIQPTVVDPESFIVWKVSAVQVILALKT